MASPCGDCDDHQHCLAAGLSKACFDSSASFLSHWIDYTRTARFLVSTHQDTLPNIPRLNSSHTIVTAHSASRLCKTCRFLFRRCRSSRLLQRICSKTSLLSLIGNKRLSHSQNLAWGAAVSIHFFFLRLSLVLLLPHLCSIRPHPYSPAYTSTYVPYFTLYTPRTAPKLHSSSHA